MASNNPVTKLYRTVVEDVINNVRENFLDEGVDDQVLQELKQLWESKILQSKAVETATPQQDKLITAYNQHQQALQQQQQQQPSSQPAQPQPVPQTAPAAQAQLQTHVPLFNPAAGQMGMSSAAQAAAVALPGGLYQQQLALQPGTIIQGQDGTQYIVQPAVLPHQGAAAPAAAQYTVGLPQVQMVGTDPHQVTAANTVSGQMVQLDGINDSSSEEDFDDNNDDDDDDEDDEKEENEEEQGEEEDPLNSGDDVSEDDPSEVFDTDNVVVCQYDKINRCKNRWKFHLKDGIMNLNGKDYVFQKASGDAEW